MESTTLICPLCFDKVDKLLYRFHLGNERQVIERIKNNNPGWSENDGICSRCIDYYHTQVIIQHRVLPEIGPHFPVKSADDFVILPTGLRVDADPRFTGKGITICFIDSSFYPHPDLVMYKNRIKEMIDMTDPTRSFEFFTKPQNAAWHGTMTSVVCAGDGYLSNGLYKGIASDAELVLLKVQDDNGKISTNHIVAALEWIDRNHKRYDIRIVNMSLGDDEAVSYKQSEIDKCAERLIEKGIIIVAAVGNNENGAIKPPANSLNVIAVGGIDDENKLDQEKKLYHSSYGKTVDELMKPELIAPAIWIAAPILPGTKEQTESVVLHELLYADGKGLQEQLTKTLSQTGLDESITRSNDVSYIRENVTRRIQTCKYISDHYMHVDGTSFAAPVVSAVIAQMLEANPQLTPAAVREVIFGTAKRLDGLAAERQGFGAIQPRKALVKILKREAIYEPSVSPYINIKQNQLEFYIHDDCASHISIAGSFNEWAPDVLQMEPGKNAVWKIVIRMLPPGRYHYKFFIDEVWMEDVNNPFREPDGYGGFNSILSIQN